MTNNDKILAKVLESLSLPESYNMAKGRRLKEIRLGTVLTLILEEKTIQEISSSLKINRSTLASMLKEVFPDKQSKQTWLAYILLSIGMKLCSSCKEKLDLSNFSPDKSKGWHSMCRPCLYEYGATRYYENKEQHRAWNSSWRENNPDKAKAIAAKRRATKKNATTKDANLSIIKKIYSKCPEGYHVDHIIPLSKGGLHHENNLCYLKISDNLHKKDKMPEEVPYVMNRAIYPFDIEGFLE